MGSDSAHSPSFVEQLDDGQRSRLLAGGTRRRYPPGAVLFVEGDPAHETLVVLRGELKVSAASFDGREVILEVFGPGDLVGELSALDGRPRSATATALSPLEVLALPCEAFNRFLLEHPALMHRLLVEVTGRLRASGRRQVEFGTGDALGRVCARLVELAERYGHPVGSDVEVTSPLSQADLAAWAGLSREAVVKALRALRALGWVQVDGRRLTIRRLDELRERASR